VSFYPLVFYPTGKGNQRQQCKKSKIKINVKKMTSKCSKRKNGRIKQKKKRKDLFFGN
jgi:hypothetical protein